MPDLKLIALDADDLAVISAHLQDAVLKVADMAFLPREKRFAAIANRFDWIDAIENDGAREKGYARRRVALRFEPGDPPQGQVTLEFAGGGAIRLNVECIEAELRDLGPVWQARSKPKHPDEPPR